MESGNINYFRFSVRKLKKPQYRHFKFVKLEFKFDSRDLENSSGVSIL